MNNQVLKDGIKAVIFDQDGLMFDTERVSAKAWKQVEGEFGIKIEESLLSRCRGRNSEECKMMFLKEFGDDLDFDTLREKKLELFFEDIKENGLPIKKGLTELLAYLKENSCKVALATASNREWSLKNLKEVGILDYFDTCICGDMVSRCKPDPEIFLTAAAGLSELPENCLVLEDSLGGVEAAITGGFGIIMVPDITQPDDVLVKRITTKCESLLEVKELFENGQLIFG